MTDGALRTVLSLYAAIDAGRATSAVGLFDDDAVFISSRGTLRGIEEVRNFLAAREAAIARRTVHALTSVSTGSTAAGLTLVHGLLLLLLPDGEGGGWRIDHAGPVRHLLRRSGDSWLIVDRRPGSADPDDPGAAAVETPVAP